MNYNEISQFFTKFKKEKHFLRTFLGGFDN